MEIMGMCREHATARPLCQHCRQPRRLLHQASGEERLKNDFFRMRDILMNVPSADCVAVSRERKTLVRGG
jgi:hypothetical protein